MLFRSDTDREMPREMADNGLDLSKIAGAAFKRPKPLVTGQHETGDELKDPGESLKALV